MPVPLVLGNNSESISYSHVVQTYVSRGCLILESGVLEVGSDLANDPDSPSAKLTKQAASSVLFIVSVCGWKSGKWTFPKEVKDGGNIRRARASGLDMASRRRPQTC